MKYKIEELNISSATAKEEAHYTEIVLSNLNYRPQGMTIKKIKDHLASIYRVFLKNNEINIKFNGDDIIYEDPEILNVPHFRDGGPNILWQKEIDFDF